MKKTLIIIIIAFLTSCSSGKDSKFIMQSSRKAFNQKDFDSGNYGVLITKLTVKNYTPYWNFFKPHQTAISTEWRKQEEKRHFDEETKKEILKSFNISQGTIKHSYLIPETFKMEDANYDIFLIEEGKYKMSFCKAFNRFMLLNGNNYSSNCWKDLSFEIKANQVMYIGDLEFSIPETFIVFSDGNNTDNTELYVKNTMPELTKRLEEMNDKLDKKVKFVEVHQNLEIKNKPTN